MAYGWSPQLNYAPDEKLDKLVKDGLLEQDQANQIKQERARLEVEEPEMAMGMRHKIQQDDVRFDVDKIEGLDPLQRTAVTQQRLAPVVAEQQKEIQAKTDSDRQVEIAKVMDNKALSVEEKRAALAAKGLDMPAGQGQPPQNLVTFGQNQPQGAATGPGGMGMPGAGFGRMRRDLRESSADYKQAVEAAGGDRQRAAAAYGKEMAELEKSNQMRYEIESDLLEQRRMDEERIAGEQAARRQRFETDRQKLQGNLARAEKEGRYFGLDYDQIQKYETDLQSEDPRVRANAQKALQKAESIDPNRLLGSAGKKIGAAIAMAMGAYAAAFTGRNDAMQIIQQAIDQDIQAQKEKRASRREGVQRAETALDRNQRTFEDDTQATEATRLQMLRATEAKLQQVGKMGEQIQNSKNFQQLQLNLANEIAATQERMAQNQNDATQRAIGTEAQLAQAQMQERAMMAKAAPGGQQVVGMEATGRRGPLDKEELKKVNAGRLNTKKSLDLLNDIRAHVAKEGRTMFFTDADGRGKRLAAQMHLELKNLFELGVLSKDDFAMLDKTFPKDPGAIRQDKVKQALDDWDRQIKRGWANVSEQYGLRDTEIGAMRSAVRNE